jgi:rare lipoprotein A
MPDPGASPAHPTLAAGQVPLVASYSTRMTEQQPRRPAMFRPRLACSCNDMRTNWTTVLLLLALGACAAPQGQPVASNPPPCFQEGEASWYRPQASNRPTADGETHIGGALTAAHPSLPFGTQVRVTNLDTGRSVVVRINDRGPVARGRIIDLSPSAAKALDMRQDGLARVRLEIAHAGSATASPAIATTDAACPLPRTTESQASPGGGGNRSALTSAG